MIDANNLAQDVDHVLGDSQPPDQPPTPRDAALNYLRNGFVPIPVQDKKPLVKWKEFQNRRPTEDEVTSWWTEWPDAGIALVCGWDGLAVIDVDQSALTDYLPFLLGDVTRMVRTPRGGLHVYVTESLPSKSGPVIPKMVDVKATGGYVVAPPTPGYTVRVDRPVQHARDAASTLATKLILGAIRSSPYLQKELGHLLPSEAKPTDDGRIPKGSRHTTLTSRAGSMRQRRLTPAEIESQLLIINERRCAPPWSSTDELAELHRIAYDIGQKPAGPLARTDLGNAERLVAHHGEDIRYCHPQGKWLVWDGCHWEVDESGRIESIAARTVRSIYEEAGQTDDEDARKSLAGWAKDSESQGKRSALVKSAQHMVPIAPEELDANSWLLNCQNGTLDLRTGNLRPPAREDYITRLLLVNYNPAAECPRWLQFLEEIIKDAEVRKFLQQAIGYSLTGDISEHALFFLYGLGANGKSTFLVTLLRLLRGYALTAAPGLLFTHRGDVHPTGIADLAGRRLVVSSEIGEGRRLDEEFVKQATGGERLRARRMQENFWEFEPTHKLWIGANHKPEIRGTDLAIWRRVKMIPFTVTIPPEKRDLELVDKLTAEGEGVLAWAVRGCLEWRHNGALRIPAAVEAATEEYRTEMDVVGEWLDECCAMTPGAEEWVKVLYTSYAQWCKDSGQYALSMTKFGHRLHDRGFERGSIRRGDKVNRGWRGLALKDEHSKGDSPSY